MVGLRVASLIVIVGTLAGNAQARAEEAGLQGGSYAVTFRLEIPHVENWAINKTTTICVPDTDRASGPPLAASRRDTPGGPDRPRRRRRRD